MAVEHNRNEARKRDPDTLAYLGAVVSITRLAINTYSVGQEETPEESLRSIGKHLVYLSSISPTEIEVLIRNELRKSITNTCIFGKLVKAEYAASAPSWWIKDTEALINSQKRITDNISEFRLFTDIKEWDSQTPEGWASFQSWLKKYGDVITLWPDFFSASKTSKD